MNPRSLVVLFDRIPPRELRRILRAERSGGREPLVVGLSAAALGEGLRALCARERIEARGPAGRLTSSAWRRLNRECGSLTLATGRALRRGRFKLGCLELEPTFRHLVYRLIQEVSTPLFVLGSFIEELEPDTLRAAGLPGKLLPTLAGCCRRRGIDLRAAATPPSSYPRYLGVRRRPGGSGPVVADRWARGLKTLATLLRSLPVRGPRRAVEILVVPVTVKDRRNWLPVGEALEDGASWGVTAWDRRVLEGYPPDRPRYPLPALLKSGRLQRWIAAYERDVEPLLARLPELLEPLPWRGFDLRPFMLYRLVDMLRMELWRGLPLISALEELLETLQPRLVVGMSERGLGVNYAFGLAAAAGIPTLALESPDMVFDSPLFGTLEADRLAAAGDYSAAVFRRHGVPGERITVTGRPRYDGPAASARDSEAEGSLPEVVFFSQPLEQKLTWELKREFIAGAALLARCAKRLKVSVKPHPREDPNELRRLLEAAGLSPDALLPVELDLYDLLNRCAVATTIFSTVGVEALVLGKPVAVLRVPGEEAVLEYTASAGVYRAFNAEELAEGVQRLLRDPELRRKLAAGRRAYLERHEAGADGGAARRVAALIGELLQGE